MDVEAHLADPVKKRGYVTVLFDVIAPGYDAFTRLFSFGMDAAWKRKIVCEAVARRPGNSVMLDLACGTGDLLLALSRAGQPRLAVGADISRRMLRAAMERAVSGHAGVHFASTDLAALAIRTASVDVVTIGYGLRNAPTVVEALREVARVLRAGGLLLNLDFYRPANRIWRKAFLGYLGYAGRAAGWLWHREPSTYGYLAPSVRRYLSVERFSELLVGAGLVVEGVHPHLGGAVCIHVASVPAERGGPRPLTARLDEPPRQSGGPWRGRR